MNVYPQRITVMNSGVKDHRKRLRKMTRKFLYSAFGVIRIKAIIDGKTYISDNISIMVTDSSQNKNVIKMIKYVYNKGREISL